MQSLQCDFVFVHSYGDIVDNPPINIMFTCLVTQAVCCVWMYVYNHVCHVCVCVCVFVYIVQLLLVGCCSIPH